MLLNASRAVTVTVKALPAVAELGPLTLKWVAAADVTVTLWEPLMPGSTCRWP